jgi:hypothetical protein
MRLASAAKRVLDVTPRRTRADQAPKRLNS